MTSNKESIKKRIRAKVSGTAERPRVALFKSNMYLYLQAIDDGARTTIAASSTLKDKEKFTDEFVKKLQTLKIKKVVFDRGGYQYHGKVKQIADDLRAKGLEF